MRQQQKQAERKDRRREQVLKCISQPGGATTGQIMKQARIQRGTVIGTVRELRREGHMIMASNMVTEDGMYQVVFELIRVPKRLPENTSAAYAALLSKKRSTGDRYASAPERGCALNAAGDAATISAGQASGDADI